ncbi:tyrosine-type recombinase/integrase [Exiguobacterium oxidotolerans]|uniref:Site-specific recombinase n=1 Tax=Exiguobacterium oxidotolerans TaxID=223958 RepID=A0A653IFQ2_9BACL|nr:tyrosine-type recombinase/integrase [Exiguobacterium oxidotolerans]VWX37821.1 Site-specific recombinase [Exiguobacterium oxidotolerans]
MARERLDYTLPEFIERYLLYLTVSGRQDSTVRRYRYDLIEVHRYMTEVDQPFETIDDFKAIPLDSWKTFINEYLIEEKLYKQATVARIVTVINQLNYQIRQSKAKLIEYAQPTHELGPHHVASQEEYDQLIRTNQSDRGLTDHQLVARPYLIDRNELILRLFYRYGLRVHHIIGLKMQDLNFAQQEMLVHDRLGNTYKLQIEREDQDVMLRYLKTVPEPVRPRYHTTDPFFVAFDFARMTFRWLYSKNAPKQLSIVMITKMMRQLNERSDNKRLITPSMLRNSFILKTYFDEMTTDDRLTKTCLYKDVSLRRYAEAFDELKELL